MTNWGEKATMIVIFVFVIIIVVFAYKAAYGHTVEENKIEYVGTSDWLNEVDKCVDLYQETEQNETLYYGCMNNLERDQVHYQ